MKMEKENVGQGTKFSVHISLGPSKSFVEVTAPFGCDICLAAQVLDSMQIAT